MKSVVAGRLHNLANELSCHVLLVLWGYVQRCEADCTLFQRNPSFNVCRVVLLLEVLEALRE